MEYDFIPKGVCSRRFHTIVEDGGVIESLTVEAGCNGYGAGMGRMLQGMHIDEAIQRLDGVKCGRKKTSCPDQMAKMYAEIKGSMA